MRTLRRLKRIVGGDGGDPPEYECKQCGTALNLQYYTCPSCGSYSVERTDWNPLDE